MQLVHYPEPILLRNISPSENKCYYEKSNIKARRMMVADMFRIMDMHQGAGLAAPQVGLNIRMFVWKQNEFGQAIWNPTLSCVSGSSESIEGCLSLPKVSVTLNRATSSIISGFGLNGRSLRIIGDATTTRIWQHEIDHLDGKLIIDNMSHADGISNRDALQTLLKKASA